MTPEATITQPNVLTTPEAFSEHNAVALGALTMEDSTFTDADLRFLATGDESVLTPAVHEPGDSPLSSSDHTFLEGAGIDARSLTGELSAEEQQRLHDQDVASAKAATDFFAHKEAQAASQTVAVRAAQAERDHVQIGIIDPADLEAAAAKKKKSGLALAA